MGKRNRVPSALHSELTEYSSLLRALRTSNTLDISAQLTKYHHNQIHNHDNDDNNVQSDDLDDDDHPLAGPSSQPPLSSQPSSSSQQTAPESQANPRKRKKRPSTDSEQSKKKNSRDLWTRWPLLAGDVIVPEWTLEDEILLFFNHLRHHGFFPDADDVDPASFVPHIAASTLNHLHGILASLAAHTPCRSGSLQNRLHPIDWQTVLQVVSCNGIDSKSIENVQRRLEALYAPQTPSENQTSHRTTAAHTAKKQLSDKLSRYGASDSMLLALAPKPPPPKPKTRKKRSG